MWVICKYKKKNFFFFKSNMQKKFNNTIKTYTPIIKYQIVLKGKKKIVKENILEDYCMCYHENFKDEKFVTQLNYVIGIEYFLKGYKENQKQILEFINYCKKNQDLEGFISQSFFSSIIKNKAKFLNGPFANLVFTILKNYKDKYKILMRDYVITINKSSNYLYRSF